jgi:hypothetical protein
MPETAAYTSQLLQNSGATLTVFAFREPDQDYWYGRMDIVKFDYHRGETTRIRYRTPEVAWYGAVSLIDGVDHHTRRITP